MSALGRHLESAHADLGALVPPDRWAAAVDDAAARIAGAGADEAVVELMRLAALPGRTSGGDGHSGVFPLDSVGRSFHLFPLRLYSFPDGYYVVAAPGHEDLVGARLVSIDGTPAGDVASLVEPLVPRDNDMTVRARLPQFLMVAEVLHGLGVIDDPTAAEVVLERDGTTFAEQLGTIHGDDYAKATGTWHPMIPPSLPAGGRALYLRRADREWWSAYLPREHVVFVQYNRTLGDSFALGRRLAKLVRRHDPHGVVLDLRHNPGGENDASAGLLEALGRLRHVPLAILVGRSTFSAAGYLSLHLQKVANPVFVGEPTGFSTRFFGDPVAGTLPGTGLHVNAGGVEWDEGRDGAYDEPLLPDVEATLSARDYFAGKDPVLERALRMLRRD